MSDDFHTPHDEPHAAGSPPATADEPRFAAIDIVNAFIALRHELKLQVRSGGELRDAVAGRLTQIERGIAASAHSLEQLASSVAAARTDDGPARRLAEALAETEESLDRAIAALDRTPEPGEQDFADVAALLEARRQQLPWLLRLPARRWCRDTVEAVQNTLRQQHTAASAARQAGWTSAVEGLGLLRDRVRRLMGSAGIRRLDVDGRPFDPERMKAVETVRSGRCPPGHVAEQLRPGYLWNDSVLKWAEVRIESP